MAVHTFNLSLSLTDTTKNLLQRRHPVKVGNLRQLFWMKYFGVPACLEARNQNGTANKYYRLVFNPKRPTKPYYAEWGRIGCDPRFSFFSTFGEGDSTFRKKINSKGYSLHNPNTGTYPFPIVEIKEVSGSFHLIAINPTGTAVTVHTVTTIEDALKFWMASTR